MMGVSEALLENDFLGESDAPDKTDVKLSQMLLQFGWWLLNTQICCVSRGILKRRFKQHVAHTEIFHS